MKPQLFMHFIADASQLICQEVVVWSIDGGRTGGGATVCPAFFRPSARTARNAGCAPCEVHDGRCQIERRIRLSVSYSQGLLARCVASRIPSRVNKRGSI